MNGNVIFGKQSLLTQIFRLLLLLLLLVVIAASSGCGGSGGSNNAAPSEQMLDCSNGLNDKECGEDLDGDGLPKSAELDGWKVLPDRFGYGLGVDAFGQMDSFYLVSSDPDKADTDGDGLDDYQEFLNKTDPRMVDTDGDGLSDAEEVLRWGSSPLSIDTDGDARGGNEDQTPNPKLFDGAELKIDLLNDPAHTPGPGATSPLFADTDGDGWDDYHEIIETLGQGFNPVIADIPQISVQIKSSPIIGFYSGTTDERTWDKSVSVTDSISESLSKETSNSKSTELVIENTMGVGITHGWEAGADGWKFVGNVNGSYEFDWSSSNSTSTSNSISWGVEQARTAEKEYQESLGEGGSLAKEMTGGYISVTVDLVNTGNIAYSLTGLRLNVLARYLNDTSDYTTALELKRGEDLALTLSPGQTHANILMSGDTGDTDFIKKLQAMLKNPNGLLFEVASYELTDADGKSFRFSEESIKQKSALVSIDYGFERATEHYLVATTPSHLEVSSHIDADSHSEVNAAGVTLATVMNDILEISYETTEITDSHGTYSVISAVNGISNDQATFKKWLLATSSDITKDGIPVDFDDLVLTAGDSLYLTLIKDEDGDGLSAREEFLSHTNDTKGHSDTDGDHLSDFEEVLGGWRVTLVNSEGYEVKSRGDTRHSDTDDLEDGVEEACKLDPNRDDTDQDGIDDKTEIEGFDVLNEGVLTLHVFPYAGIVVLDGGNGEAETLVAAGSDDVVVETGSVDKGAVLITAGEDGIVDVVLGGDDYIGANHVPLDCDYGSTYATNPLNADTDGDSQIDGNVELAGGLGSPNNPNDAGLLNDEDGDGLSDAAELEGFSALINGSPGYYFYSDPEDVDGDSDDDGLPDLLEKLLGSNPQDDDTDGDGIKDFIEDGFDKGQIKAQFDAICNRVRVEDRNCHWPEWGDGEGIGTYVTNNDTDSDGLTDGKELDGWAVYVDNIRVNEVTTNPLINEDKDADGLSDYGEFFYKTDPDKYDTDGDGSNRISGDTSEYGDGHETGICASYKVGSGVGPYCRSPIAKDRKYTVTYESITYQGECDWNITWWDTNNELEWLLGLRYTDTTLPIQRISISAESKQHRNNVWPISVKKDYSKKLNKSFEFIAHEGNKFELFGYAGEKDSVTETWTIFDGGFAFYSDSTCSDCIKTLTGYDSRRLDIFNSPDLAFTAGTDSEFSFDPSSNVLKTALSFGYSSLCGNSDNNEGTPLPIVPTSVTVKANVTAE